VAIGVPKATVMAELYQWMGWAIGGATTISLIGIILAMGIARSIAEDIQALVKPAVSIGRGELVAAIDDLSVKETEEVAAALVQASELLQRRERERDEAEWQLSRTIDLLQEETAERLRATEALLERERMLIQQSRLAALGEMIRNIAHQWRQPLNVVGLVAQELPLMYESGQFNKAYLDERVDKIKEVIFHMSQTINDFGNFFRPDKEKELFKVNQVVRQTLSLIEESFKELDVKIEIDATGDPVIDGYPNEYSQALINILFNARDAFLEGKVGKPWVVKINMFTEETRAVVTITDNAGGISEDIMDKIFDPYFSTKEPDKGTGVGLFMTNTIISKSMGGTVKVRNIGDGAEFRIEVG
jgi:two-component system C4-dicarboxylate transport sensor histidine kinase DctB